MEKALKLALGEAIRRRRFFDELLLFTIVQNLCCTLLVLLVISLLLQDFYLFFFSLQRMWYLCDICWKKLCSHYGKCNFSPTKNKEKWYNWGWNLNGKAFSIKHDFSVCVYRPKWWVVLSKVRIFPLKSNNLHHVLLP